MDYSDIANYLSGQSGPEEKKRVEDWIGSSPQNRRRFQRWHRIWEAAAKAAEATPADEEAAWLKVRAATLGKVEKIKEARVRALWRWSAAAAAILLVITFGYIGALYFSRTETVILTAESAADIRQIELPDGTKVWLNRHSRLSYPERFISGRREVSLSGEAFFEVTRDPDAPFEITTAEAGVEVLGTSFDVMAYPDSQRTTVQVSTGRVAFFQNQATNGSRLVLEAGNRAALNHGDLRLERLEAKPNGQAWQNRIIRFEKTSLGEVARVMRAVYGIEVEFADPSATACQITAGFNNEPPEAIFTALEVLFSLTTSQIDSTSYLIEGSGCR